MQTLQLGTKHIDAGTLTKTLCSPVNVSDSCIRTQEHSADKWSTCKLSKNMNEVDGGLVGGVGQ